MIKFGRGGFDYFEDGPRGGKIKRNGKPTKFLWEEYDKRTGLRDRGVIKPPGDCIVVTCVTTEVQRLETALATERFKHLDAKFKKYPHCPKKRYILMGRSEEHRMEDDGSIMDLFYHL